MRIYEKLKFCFLFIVSCLLTVVSEATIAQDSIKIGYVNATQIVSQAPQGQEAFSQIQREFADRENQLRDLQADIDSLEGRLADAANLQLTQDEISILERQIRDLSRELDRGSAELNEDFNYRRNEELEKLQELISELILTIAREENYDLIVQSPVVWASERINLTDEVLAELVRMFNQ